VLRGGDAGGLASGERCAQSSADEAPRGLEFL
jgi:hypothetical protein